MAQNSKIEWTHHTANLWHGCTKVHEGCDHCYAETLSHRWGRDIWGNDKPRMMIKSVWDDLKKYQQLAKEAGEMHRVFVGSMMDIFEKPMPLITSDGTKPNFDTDSIRAIFFEKITMGLYPNLLFLFLTKRPSNINKYIPKSWKENPPANVMFGTSISNKNHNHLVNQLEKVNGKRFLSIEPLLGHIDLDEISTSGIDWVICGGESGHEARPMNPIWAIDLKDQCRKRGIPFFFKQFGEFKYYGGYPIPVDDLNKIKFYWENGSFHPIEKGTSADKISCFPLAVDVGKKASGRMLDGKIYNEFPKQFLNPKQ